VERKWLVEIGRSIWAAYQLARPRKEQTREVACLAVVSRSVWQFKEYPAPTGQRNTDLTPFSSTL
jgi:hypothetical protein